MNDIRFHARSLSLSLFRSLSACNFIGNAHKERERERLSLQHLAAEQRVDDHQNDEAVAVGEQQQQEEQQPQREELGELLELIPLGAGSEVGRSCVVASFSKGRKTSCSIAASTRDLAGCPRSRISTKSTSARSTSYSSRTFTWTTARRCRFW